MPLDNSFNCLDQQPLHSLLSSYSKVSTLSLNPQATFFSLHSRHMALSPHWKKNFKQPQFASTFQLQMCPNLPLSPALENLSPHLWFKVNPSTCALDPNPLLASSFNRSLLYLSLSLSDSSLQPLNILYCLPFKNLTLNLTLNPILTAVLPLAFPSQLSFLKKSLHSSLYLHFLPLITFQPSSVGICSIWCHQWPPYFQAQQTLSSL